MSTKSFDTGGVTTFCGTWHSMIVLAKVALSAREGRGDRPPSDRPTLQVRSCRLPQPRRQASVPRSETETQRFPCACGAAAHSSRRRRRTCCVSFEFWDWTASGPFASRHTKRRTDGCVDLDQRSWKWADPNRTFPLPRWPVEGFGFPPSPARRAAFSTDLNIPAAPVSPVRRNWFEAGLKTSREYTAHNNKNGRERRHEIRHLL
jgi:hypothetical protein